MQTEQLITVKEKGYKERWRRMKTFDNALKTHQLQCPRDYSTYGIFEGIPILNFRAKNTVNKSDPRP